MIPKFITKRNLTATTNSGPRMCSSLDQNKLFVSESLVPLTQLAKWYKEPTIPLGPWKPLVTIGDPWRPLATMPENGQNDQNVYS